MDCKRTICLLILWLSACINRWIQNTAGWFLLKPYTATKLHLKHNTTYPLTIEMLHDLVRCFILFRLMPPPPLPRDKMVDILQTTFWTCIPVKEIYPISNNICISYFDWRFFLRAQLTISQYLLCALLFTSISASQHIYLPTRTPNLRTHNPFYRQFRDWNNK